nr:carbon starvation CstA family protein [Thermodesulfobacterium geofontis]
MVSLWTHFAAIAGVGPLIGPVLAAQFGYLPGFFWILIRGVLAGAVHDMVILLRIDFLLALVKTMLKRFITSIALFSKSLSE